MAGGMMKCPSCGASMPVGGKCKSCGYVDKSGGGKQAPPKKAPGKGKAPAKGGKVPPQFAKRGTGY